MIPVRLSLRNFMSYGDERAELDFTGVHLACLSGDNGNGKSALLDAITYALWGKTRASGSQASSEDDLVRLGAEEMEVVFEFRLGDDRYRAARKRNRRTHTGDWQLDLLDAGGAWQPCGGTTMHDVGRALTRLLRMEYETFLNSAYIQQGRADEFTRQKPNDRKRILADILDLSRYDRLEEMARDRRTECELLLKDLEGEIRHYDSRAAETQFHRDRLETQEAEIAAWTAERGARDAELRTAREALAALEAKAQRLRDREERLRAAEAEMPELDADLCAVEARLAEAGALLAERDAILADAARLAEARDLLARLDPERRALDDARHTRHALQSRIQGERQKLLIEIERAEGERRRVVERRREVEEMDARLADVARKLAVFETARAERARVGSALAEAQEAFTELRARNTKLTAEIAEVEELLPFLSAARSACPLCESDLSGGRQEAVRRKQEGKLKRLREQLAEVRSEGAAAKRQRDALQQEREKLEAQLLGEAALNAQRLEWAARRDRAAAELQDSSETLQRLDDLRARLAAEDYAADARAELARLEARIAELEAANARRGEAQAVVDNLTRQQVDRRQAQLDEAERGQAQAQEQRARLTQRRERLAKQLDAERAGVAEARSELAGYDAARLAALDAERRAAEAARKREEALGQAERTRHALEECARALELAARKKVERDRIAKDRQAYMDLAAAFGKKGVQAHIIDNALPEIEEDANRLLARLTDNALQIRLSTLRQARSGSSQIETLDISITDDAGARPYEMYSGGEAFRVNFAVRIALSRLLARRAGARLQTLILDEGFGTQDARGRERLVEAIEAVKDEFALVLVISHIEELKDAFPTRIEVSKTPLGSQLTLL